jgi:hypothetical protein|tara:strand:- start:3634 stop:3927 length:294 start_codon:yes stop_codon:yes gene_type:complete
MSEKLTEAEITQIQNIRNDYTMLVTALGDLELRKLTLKNQKEELHQEFKKLQGKELALGVNLETKYGQGVVNMETGLYETLETETSEVEVETSEKVD